MSLIEIAQELYEEGEYLDSLGFVSEILEDEPENLKALELKADLYYVMDDMYEAIRINEKLLRFYEDNEKIWEQLYALNAISLSHWDLGSYDQAISYCERSIELCERFLKSGGPDKEAFAQELIDKLWLLGIYQWQSERHSRAIGTYKKLLELLPEFGCLESIADALYELACTYYDLNRNTEALSTYSKALKTFEGLEKTIVTSFRRSRTHYCLGSIRFATRDFKKAFFHLEKCALLLEKSYRDIKGQGDVEDFFFYKRAKRLLNSLEKNKSLWKK